MVSWRFLIQRTAMRRNQMRNPLFFFAAGVRERKAPLLRSMLPAQWPVTSNASKYGTRCLALQQDHDPRQEHMHSVNGVKRGRWADGAFEWIRGDALPRRRALPVAGRSTDRVVITGEHWQQIVRDDKLQLASFRPRWAVHCVHDTLGVQERGTRRRWWGVPISQNAVKSRDCWDRAHIATHSPYALAHIPIFRDFPHGTSVGWGCTRAVAGPCKHPDTQAMASPGGMDGVAIAPSRMLRESGPSLAPSVRPGRYWLAAGQIGADPENQQLLHITHAPARGVAAPAPAEASSWDTSSSNGLCFTMAVPAGRDVLLAAIWLGSSSGAAGARQNLAVYAKQGDPKEMQNDWKMIADLRGVELPSPPASTGVDRNAERKIMVRERNSFQRRVKKLRMKMKVIKALVGGGSPSASDQIASEENDVLEDQIELLQRKNPHLLRVPCDPLVLVPGGSREPDKAGEGREGVVSIVIHSSHGHGLRVCSSKTLREGNLVAADESLSVFAGGTVKCRRMQSCFRNLALTGPLCLLPVLPSVSVMCRRHAVHVHTGRAAGPTDPLATKVSLKRVQRGGENAGGARESELQERGFRNAANDVELADVDWDGGGGGRRVGEMKGTGTWSRSCSSSSDCDRSLSQDTETTPAAPQEEVLSA